MLNIFVLLIVIFSYFLVGGLFPAKKPPPPSFTYTGGVYLEYPDDRGGQVNPQTKKKSCPDGTEAVKSDTLTAGVYGVIMYFCKNESGSAPDHTYRGGGWFHYPDDGGQDNLGAEGKTCPDGTFAETIPFTCNDTTCVMIACRIL